MLYTFFFYLLILICYKSNVNDYSKQVKSICWVIGIYMGLRYNYLSDYDGYQRIFNEIASGQVYDPITMHVEYGWYLLNKIFAPLGYYFFVFIFSCVFAYGLYCLLICFKTSEFIVLISWGIVSSGGFTTSFSAQRQLLAISLFCIAYRFLLYKHISSIKELLSIRMLLYICVVCLCSQFHKSSLFYLLIPIVSILPRKSILVLFAAAGFAAFLVFYGESIITPFVQDITAEYEVYNYIDYSDKYSGSITFLQSSMWVFQLAFTIFVYLKNDIDNDSKNVLLISIIYILIILLGQVLDQVGRIALYIYIFNYINIAVVSHYLNNKTRNVYIAGMYVWVIWNMSKSFLVTQDYQIYKPVFELLWK